MRLEDPSLTTAVPSALQLNTTLRHLTINVGGHSGTNLPSPLLLPVIRALRYNRGLLTFTSDHGMTSLEMSEIAYSLRRHPYLFALNMTYHQHEDDSSYYNVNRGTSTTEPMHS